MSGALSWLWLLVLLFIADLSNPSVAGVFSFEQPALYLDAAIGQHQPVLRTALAVAIPSQLGTDPGPREVPRVLHAAAFAHVDLLRGALRAQLKRQYPTPLPSRDEDDED
jgi:hypothetical protein